MDSEATAAPSLQAKVADRPGNSEAQQRPVLVSLEVYFPWPTLSQSFVLLAGQLEQLM
jgi:hypothetical protein